MGTRIVVFCDPCDAQGEDTPGEEVTLSLNGSPPKRLAFCASHSDQFVKPLQALLDEFGGPTAPPAAAAGTGQRKGKAPADGQRPDECLWCELTYASRGGLAQHLQTAHGFPTLKEAYGNVCPLCGEQCAVSNMVSHARKAHTDVRPEWSSATELFVAARATGDPHGIVTQRVAGVRA